MVWLFGVSGKESLKALEKEVELLKQQLHGKINTGQTYLHKEEQARTDTKEKKKNEKENEDGKKKKKQTRMTSLNLLAELQKFNLNTDSLSPLSSNHPPPVPITETQPCSVNLSNEVPQNEMEVLEESGRILLETEEKENTDVEERRSCDLAVDQYEKSDEVKVHKGRAYTVSCL